MIQNVLLVLVLVVSLVTGAPVQGGEVGEELEALPIPPHYQLLVAQDPVDENVFHVWAPNEVITPVRVEAVVGGSMPEVSGRHFKVDAVEGFVGPFDWHPAFPDGWGLTITFDDVPSVVTAVVVAWDGTKPHIGCGYWIGPRPVGGEVFLPSVFATDK